MKPFKISLALLFIIAAVAGLVYYFSPTRPSASGTFPKLPPKEGVIDIDWPVFDKIAIAPDGKITGDYPPEIKSIIGKRIRLFGAAYLLQQGIVNNEIHSFILMPTEMADLSTPTPEPKIQRMLTVYVDYRASPLPLKDYLFRTGQSLPLFYAEGVFEISPNRNFGLFILQGSVITPFTIK